MYDVNATFSSEQAKIEGTFPISLYVINASQSGTDYIYYINANQDVYGYIMNASGDLGATEQLFTGLPITQGTIDSNAEGEISALSISVPNTDRVIESVIQNNSYLRGMDVHIITTFAKHLPSGVTANHIGTTPDRYACMKEKMYIDSTSSNEEVVTFSCKPKFVIDKMSLPGRRFTVECGWEYDSTECDVSATMAASYLTCNYTLNDCKLRQNEERYGGFQGIPRRGILIM